MAKRISETLTYPGTTVTQIADMFADPEFRKAVAAYQRAVKSEATVARSDSGMDIHFQYSHGTEHVPGFARKLVGDEIPIVQDEKWTTNGDGLDAAVTIVIPGKPGDMSGTAKLRQVGDDVVETVELTVKVGIPLVGGKVEDLIAGLLTKALRAENKVGLKWLAGEWRA